jgi:DNA polymerase-3 subunit delta
LFYIIHGPDNYSVHQELGKIKQGLGDQVLLSTNTSILDGRQLSLNELTDICSAIPLFSPFRLVIVEGLLEKFDIGTTMYGQSKHISKVSSGLKDWESLSGYIGNIPQTTILVFIYNIEIKNAGKNPLFKLLSPIGKLISCPQPERKNIEELVKRKIDTFGGKITPSAIRLLVEHIGGDLWAIHNSVDMLINYSSGATITDNEVMKLTSFAKEASVFDLIDAIINKKIERAQRYLHNLILEGATSFYILAMIARQIRLIVRAKDINPALNRPQIMSNLGITKEFALDKTLTQAKHYTFDNLREAYCRVLDADIAIKTGRYDGDLAIELLVMDLCRK